MSSIGFFYEDVPFRLKTVRKTKAWIKDVINAENRRLGELSFIFCSDNFLLKINIDYLNHDTLTDIITFNNSYNSVDIDGDVFVSVDRVKENSKKFNCSFNHELHRVIIHGVLHLVGYSDKTPSQKRMMRKKEDSYLSLVKF